MKELASETKVVQAEARRVPVWYKVLAGAVGGGEATFILLTLYLAGGRAIAILLFYGVILTLALLTSLPVGIGLLKGYLFTEKTSDLKALEKSVEAAAAAAAAAAWQKEEQVVIPGEERVVSLKDRLSLSNLVARKISPRTRVITLAGSAVIALVLILIVTFAYPKYTTRPAYDNAMVLVLILALVPPSILDVISRAYLKQIDSRIPDFLRDISESQRTGLAFTRALMNSAYSNYGALTKELKKAMVKMPLGFTYEDALDSFADSAETPLSHRAAVLLKEVGRSGGKMIEVLDSIYEHIREVITLQKERSKQLTPYIMVIYASFGVYIFVVYILFSTFFAQVAQLVNSGAPFGTNISPGVYYIWFYHMSVIEAVFGGLVAGKISAGSSVAGLKHILILLLISFVAFTFFIHV